eukprot:6210785-Pleurochrysis_carterae.AAC.4
MAKNLDFDLILNIKFLRKLTVLDVGLATNFPSKPKLSWEGQGATSAKALAHKRAKGPSGPSANEYDSDIARAQIYAMAALGRYAKLRRR